MWPVSLFPGSSSGIEIWRAAAKISTSGEASATRPEYFGEKHATAAGSHHSNRAALDPGASDCADRGFSRGRSRRIGSPLYGVDLFRDGFHSGRNADGSGQDAARPRRLLRILRGRSRRRQCRRTIPARFCKPAAPVSAHVLAASRRPDAGASGRLERAGPRATHHFLTTKHSRDRCGLGRAKLCR